MSILTISNLGKQFCMHHANRMIRSCENISFTLEQGDFIGIVGRSGAGKSTILNVLTAPIFLHGAILFTTAQLLEKSIFLRLRNVKLSISEIMK